MTAFLSWIWSIRFARCYPVLNLYWRLWTQVTASMSTSLWKTSLKPFNFNNSNQLMPDLQFQQSRHDNEIQLSFCWKLLSAYFAEKKMITKYSSNCAKCACIRNTNVGFFQCMHAGQVGQHFNLCWVIRLSHNSILHEVQYKRPVATWPPMGVVSSVYRSHCEKT